MEWNDAIHRVQNALKAEGMSPRTIQEYGYDLSHIAKHIAKSPESIDRADIQDFILSCQDRDVGHRTINRKLSALRTFYNHLIEQGRLTKNPVLEVRYLKTRKDKTSTFLSLSQANKLSEMIHALPYGERHAFTILFMARMGLRIGEVARLNLADVNYEQRILRVHGKGSRIRQLPIPTDVFEQLGQFMTYRARYAKPGEDALFVSRRGNRISVRTLHHWFHKAAAAAGLYTPNKFVRQRVTPHKLRHTFAVHAIKGGTDILTLQYILGHENIQTTTVYVEADSDRVSAAMENHPLRAVGANEPQ